MAMTSEVNAFTDAKAAKSFSFFPIVMYDSDIGFGFGGKTILKNYYQKDESFDLVLFGSTRGEQWYQFTFSVPDFEIRQGKKYPWALDFSTEYLKSIISNYFGIGNNTRDNDFNFTNESVKIKLALSHAFNPAFISSIKYNLMFFSLYDYKKSNQYLNKNTKGIGESQLSNMQLELKYDNRDSQINPAKGYKVLLSYTLADKLFGGDWEFNKQSLESALYKSIFEKHIFAARILLENISGTSPIQALSTIGGGWSARGYKLDRFKDNSLSLFSLEYRFPIYSKLGGVVFEDMGRVYSGLKYLSFDDWHPNSGFGLRYLLENFVVRMDVGISKESTRIYFNFGHVF